MKNLSKNIKVIASIIKSQNGKAVTVTFTKKDGTERVLNGRLGVKKGVTGKGLAYNPKDYDLITVFDMRLATKFPANPEKCYRMVNLKTVSEVKAAGVVYKF